MLADLRSATTCLALFIAALGTVRSPAQEAAPTLTAQSAAESAEQSELEAEQPEDRQGEENPTEIPLTLLERDPFDRVTLNAENENMVLETVLLDLPERAVPSPLPTSGKLVIRRVSEPSIPYEVDWAAVAKVELYEQILLAEAERLTAAGEFAEGFAYYAFLSSHYPQLPGLEAALQSHLWREASAAYADNRRDEAWSVLHALYLRNAEYPRLINAVQAVSDAMILLYYEQQNYAAARSAVEMLEGTFPKLGLQNVAAWRERIQADALAQLDKARAAFAAERFSEARGAIARARAILPTTPGGDELWEQIQGAAPEIRVAVSQAAGVGAVTNALTWPAARITALVNPRLVEMVDFGAEGGVYASRWGDLSTSDDGLETTIRLSAEGFARGIDPDRVALGLAQTGVESGVHADFAAIVAGLRINNGQDVVVRWRRLHVRPEALLQAPLRSIVSAKQAPGLWFEPVQGDNAPGEHPFERTGDAGSNAGEARFIVELESPNDEKALSALMRGEVDVVDRVPPWQLDRMESAENIVVAQYRLPTSHVLIPNPQSRLLETREFRRALCYGIDAESILNDVLLGGESRPGFRTISGPFLAGSSRSDPVGYAYNADLAPRPYEPRMAAILASAARQVIAKRDAAEKKASAESAKGNSKEANVENAKREVKNPSEQNVDDDEKNSRPTPIILAHSTDPLARLACQSIKAQLDSVGIPVKLAEFAEESPAADMTYDLYYAELAVWEPVVDARRLLGADGLVGRTSPLMALALGQLAESVNWNEARAQLHEIHRIAYYDLPILPLWQTVNSFAYRQEMEGIGDNPVSLYQSLPDWRKTLP